MNGAAFVPGTGSPPADEAAPLLLGLVAAAETAW